MFCQLKWQNKKGGVELVPYICEDGVCELEFLGVHTLLDDRVPNLDILGVLWSLLECGDGNVHSSPLAKLDEPLREFIRPQKWALSSR
jgi:hypothetical protein